MSIKICKLPLNERDRFLQFVRKVNPKRLKAEERFNWQMTENPHLTDKETPPVFIAINRDNNIVGHFLIIPFSWYFKGQTYDGFWGVDYFVEEEHRGVAGAMLAMKVIRGNQPYFTIDPSKVAEQIATILRATTVGQLQRSIWFCTGLSALKLKMNDYLINSYLKRPLPFQVIKSSRDNYPELLDNSDGIQFKRADKLAGWSDYEWPGVLGFSRSVEFVNWRFFSGYAKYYFYRLKGRTEVYFVARPAVWKGIKVLALVDYRLPHGDEKSWQAILQAVKKLAKLNGCDGVFTMYSHASFEGSLKENGFQNIGKPLLIISTACIDLPDTNVENRTAVFATMADCDIDVNFGK